VTAVRKPTKAEIIARDEAVAAAGGAAPPHAARPGFAGLVGQQAIAQALHRALDRNRLPHALLLHGPGGVGKATCAGVLAQALNCSAGEFRDACGECPSCQKIARGLHPDVLWVEPMQPGKTLLRQVVLRPKDKPPSPHEPIVKWLGYKAYEGTRRVVVIDDAHTMIDQAQNALLKTLEEPPGSSMLVLVTPNAGSLLPTIRSRCQTLRLQPLGTELMRRHLEDACDMSAEESRLRAALAPGSLGRAIGLDLDEYAGRRDVAETAVRDAYDGGAALLASAEAILAAGAGERKIDQAASAMSAVRDVLRDLLVLATGEEAALMINVDRIEDWGAWANDLDAAGIIAALGEVQQADDRLRSPLQPNARLTVEEALIGVGAALRSGVLR